MTIDKQLKELIDQREVFLQRGDNLDRCTDVVTSPTDEDGIDYFSFAHPASDLVLESGDRIPLAVVESEDLVVLDGNQPLPLDLVLA